MPNIMAIFRREPLRDLFATAELLVPFSCNLVNKQANKFSNISNHKQYLVVFFAALTVHTGVGWRVGDDVPAA